MADAGKGAIGFLYYSGHGANRRNKHNYLIPIGVERLDDPRVWYKSVALDAIIQTLDDTASQAAHFVVFDACRNVLKTKGKGETDKGFVAMRERRGMLIAFSTEPGATASDKGQSSGPYATVLAAELVKPGLDHADLFQNVKEQVFERTRGQLPWTRDGLTSRIYLNGKMTAEVRRRARAKAQWRKVKKTKDPVKLEAFAQAFDGTDYADFARTLAETLRAARREAQSAATRPPKPRQQPSPAATRPPKPREQASLAATRPPKPREQPPRLPPGSGPESEPSVREKDVSFKTHTNAQRASGGSSFLLSLLRSVAKPVDRIPACRRHGRFVQFVTREEVSESKRSSRRSQIGKSIRPRS